MHSKPKEVLEGIYEKRKEAWRQKSKKDYKIKEKKRRDSIEKWSKEKREKYITLIQENNKGDKNPNAKTIYIYNSNNIVEYSCVGNFHKICKIHNLPRAGLQKTIKNNNTLYERRISSNIEWRNYKGWYARHIGK